MVEISGDQRPTILGLSIAFPIIATLAVALRFQARRIKRVPLGADDWTILAALVLTLGVTFDILVDSRVGRLGWHTEFTPDGLPIANEAFKVFGKTTYVLEILIWPAIGLNKISVLLFYKRIFVDRSFQIVVWCFIGVCVAWTITFEFALMFSCWPVASNWDPYIEFTCVDQKKLFTAALATDVITDGLILLLPVYNVWKLQMRTRRKIAVVGIFLLGGFTTITGIIRLHFLNYAFAALGEPLFADVACKLLRSLLMLFLWLTLDPDRYAPAFYWSIIETNTGVLSACLPTLRPLFDEYPLVPLVSRLLGSLTSGFRSSMRSAGDHRLGSMEHGLNELQSKALGVHQNKAYATYDDSHADPEIPNAIFYAQKFDVTRNKSAA